eukprot:PhF_6_TR28325/c0_g1_i2/m.41969/K01940/argG, ASS1; argininosuccinate synthase
MSTTPLPPKERVLLAFTGGLSSCCVLKYLIVEGYEVYCLICDIGQQTSVEEAKTRATSYGAVKVFLEDLRTEFVTGFVFKSVQANAVYDGKNLLGTSLSRPCIARKQIELARREGCVAVAHGASGRTNDIVRFELAYHALNANIRVLAPYRDPRFLELVGHTRQSLLDFAHKHGVNVTVTSDVGATDQNIFSSQHTGQAYEDPSRVAPESVYTWVTNPTETPDLSDTVSIEFKAGIPIKVVEDGSGIVTTDSVGILTVLNKLGAKHGIGRVDTVVNSMVGVKTRMILETPGGSILRMSHQDLEGLTMDREVRRLRDMMSPKFAELVFNGFWFSPEMDFLSHAIAQSQEHVNGVIKVRVFKGTCLPVYRECPGESKGLEKGVPSLTSPEDTKGYVQVAAARLRHLAMSREKIIHKN